MTNDRPARRRKPGGGSKPHYGQRLIWKQIGLTPEQWNFVARLGLAYQVGSMKDSDILREVLRRHPLNRGDDDGNDRAID